VHVVGGEGPAGGLAADGEESRGTAVAKQRDEECGAERIEERAQRVPLPPQASGLLRLVAREDAAPRLEDREPRRAGRNAPDAGRPTAPHEGVVLALPERRPLDEEDLAERGEQVLHDRVAVEERRHELAGPGNGVVV